MNRPLKSLPLVAAFLLAAASASGQKPTAAQEAEAAATLGRLDAILTQCAKADAKNRTTYERYRTELIVFGEGTAHEMRVPGSDTPQYKEAYQVLTTELNKQSRDDLAAQCAKFIDAKS